MSGNSINTASPSGLRRGPKSFDDWVKIIRHALRYQTDYFGLEHTPLVNLPFVKASAAAPYGNRTYARGKALRDTLDAALDEIIEETREDGLTTISQVLQGIRDHKPIKEVAGELDHTREHISRKYAWRGYELVTRCFFELGEQYQAQYGQPHRNGHDPPA